MTRVLVKRHEQMPQTHAECRQCIAEWDEGESIRDQAKAHVRRTQHEVVVTSTERSIYRSEATG